MAKAPTPGRAQAEAAAKAEAQVVLRITNGEQMLEVQPSALTLKERFVIRSSTGLPFEAFFSGGEHAIGEDSVAVLWWCARRANGEPTLAFRQFMDEWVFDPEHLEIEEVEPDEDDDRPEG